MGDVIWLDERRTARQVATDRPSRLRATFFFDLASPFTYLAAERVDRMFPALDVAPRADARRCTPAARSRRRRARGRAGRPRSAR